MLSWSVNIQILFEISLAIGTSLDITKMLRTALSAFLRKLNCSAGGVYAFERGAQDSSYRKIFSIPRDTDHNTVFQAALARLPVPANAGDGGPAPVSLPIHGQPQAEHYFHILELPKYGVLILLKNGEDVDDAILKSLDPLLLRLAEACLSCLHRKQLADAHDLLEERIVERTADLEEANRQLKEEISERKTAEEKLLVSLQEKEMLMREIHHRVKNNYQMICSILNLEQFRSTNRETVTVLSDAIKRVKSMSLIHQKFYAEDNLTRIDFVDYVQELASQLLAMKPELAERVQVAVSGDRFVLPLVQAIPAALIMNEMLTNSLKHAFPGDRRGTIDITLSQEADGRCRLRFSDDGTGIPQGAAILESKSMGMYLMSNLASQMRGKLEMEDGPGTTYLISFWMNRARDRGNNGANQT